MKKLITVLIFAAGIAKCGFAQTADSPWKFDFGTGAGYLSGDVNYQIGGRVVDSGGSYFVNDPFPNWNSLSMC
jgi:hypothetical protein